MKSDISVNASLQYFVVVHCLYQKNSVSKEPQVTKSKLSAIAEKPLIGTYTEERLLLEVTGNWKLKL